MPNDKYLNIGNMDIDYVNSDGNLVKNGTSRMVMIRSKSDLDTLPDSYEPTTFAFTAGFKNLYQKDADGEWQAVVEESDG